MDAFNCECTVYTFTTLRFWSYPDIKRLTKINLRRAVFPHCDGVPSEHQVLAGGSRRKLPQLCVSCISTPPHCLTQLLSFIYCWWSSSPCALTALRHYSTTSSVIPHRPGMIHLCSPHTHTHTHTSVRTLTAAVLHEQRCVRTAAALRMPLNTSFLFFQDRSSQYESAGTSGEATAIVQLQTWQSLIGWN